MSRSNGPTTGMGVSGGRGARPVLWVAQTKTTVGSLSDIRPHLGPPVLARQLAVQYTLRSLR